MTPLDFFALLIFVLLLISLLRWLRNGNGGKLGQYVRNSDYHAWRMAVEDKKQELDELYHNKPPSI